MANEQDALGDGMGKVGGGRVEMEGGPGKRQCQGRRSSRFPECSESGRRRVALTWKRGWLEGDWWQGPWRGAGVGALHCQEGAGRSSRAVAWELPELRLAFPGSGGGAQLFLVVQARVLAAGEGRIMVGRDPEVG